MERVHLAIARHRLLRRRQRLSEHLPAEHRAPAEVLALPAKQRVLEALETKEAQELAQKLSSLEIVIHRQVGEGDKMYGSVTSRDIEEALAAKGFVVDRRRISSDALRSLGKHPVTIRLASSVSATIQVEVAPKA